MNKFLFKSKVFLSRNSSTILTCIGGVGVVATVVTAVKATPKAMALIEEAKEEKGADLTKVETVITAAPAFQVERRSCVFSFIIDLKQNLW